MIYFVDLFLNFTSDNFEFCAPSCGSALIFQSALH